MRGVGLKRGSDLARPALRASVTVTAALVLGATTPPPRLVATMPEDLVGTWDLTPASCKEPDSIHRMVITRFGLKQGSEAPVPPKPLEMFSTGHTDHKIKLRFESPREGDNSPPDVYIENLRFVIDDSGDRFFLEGLPTRGETFNPYSRIYMRCGADFGWLFGKLRK